MPNLSQIQGHFNINRPPVYNDQLSTFREKEPLGNDHKGHNFGVPRVVVVLWFDCVFKDCVRFSDTAPNVRPVFLASCIYIEYPVFIAKFRSNRDLY